MLRFLLAKLGISDVSWGSQAYDLRITLFRILFGGVLAYFFGELAFTGKGVDHYVDPIYLFRYPGFEWIPVLPDHLLMGVIYVGFVAAIMFAIGAFFRLSALVLSLSFIYTFLLDISYWNNHYYFYAMVTVVFIFTNAGNSLSLDSLLKPAQQKPNSGWELWLFRFIVGVVFFYGGISKISNPDWLSNASASAIFTGSFERLGIELNSATFDFVTWFISLFGLIFDLLVPFALISKKPWVRIIALIGFVPFNIANSFLLRIGTFPFALLGSIALYLHPTWLKKLGASVKTPISEDGLSKATSPIIWAFVVWQLLFPLRHWLIEGNMFWTSEGKLYGWFMMSGSIKVISQDMYLSEYSDDGELLATHHANLSNFLKKEQMRTLGHWPFLIPDFARFMKREAELAGMKNVKVTADILISRNRKKARHIVSPKVDLASLKKNPWGHDPWILLYAQEGY